MVTPDFFQSGCEMDRCVGAAATMLGDDRKGLAGVGAIGDGQRSVYPAPGEPQIRLPAGEQGASRSG
jgi:hypothetical protein